MEIKIITIHAMHNPGSVFQAYALQSYLDREHNAEIIDYRPAYFYSEGSSLKLLLKKTLFHKNWKSREKKYNGFIRRNMRLTQQYSSHDELKVAGLTADAFIVGSDQLWNTDYQCGRDLSFYLDFVEHGRKISYSTSVGKPQIDEAGKELYVTWLMSFDGLSVRERSTALALSELLNRHVEWVCDPVFLLEKEEYTRFVGKRTIKEDYAVVYMSEASELLDSVVDCYRKKGLKIILAGGFTRRCICDRHIVDVGPEDFLSLLYYANAVISSSFHATAFCHIFHKEFITLVPPKNGERIFSLVRHTGLESRAISDRFDHVVPEMTVNWDDVDRRLKNYVEWSKQFLLTALKEG